MPITDLISDADISADPSTGKVTGDANPASSQDGVITKLRDIDDDLNADFLGRASTWDSHNHDAGATPGGQPIGTGGVAAIASAQVTTALINGSAITGTKTAAGAIGTAEIADNTVEKLQIGAPQSASKAATGTGTKTFTFNGASNYVLYSVEYDDSSVPSGSCLITLKNATTSSVDVGHVFGGATFNIIVRAYGCTSIS